MGSSQTRNQFCVPGIKRQILNHWITREVQEFSVFISELCHRSEQIPEVNLPPTNTHTKCHPQSPEGQATRGLSETRHCSPTWSLLLLLEEAYFCLLYPRWWTRMTFNYNVSFFIWGAKLQVCSLLYKSITEVCNTWPMWDVKSKELRMFALFSLFYPRNIISYK